MGSQSIDFSNTPEKNVTIIHGENGSGKTTLLNAITWCLYSHTSPDFEESDYLLSKKAVLKSNMNDIIECSVVLKFTDSNLDYEAIRKYKYRSLGPNKKPSKHGVGSFELFIKKDGERRKADNPNVFINRIIPKEMHSYFFFNGERIDRLARRSNNFEIREAIKVLLGVTILERALVHLKAAHNIINTQLSNNSRLDHNIRNILLELTKNNKDLEHNEKCREHCKKNAGSLKKDNEAIRDKLRDFKETRELEEKRDELFAEDTELSSSIKSIEKRIIKFITRKSCFSFMGPVFEQVNNILKDLKTSNILPNEVKEDFIRRLLAENLCICKRKLANDSKASAAVKKLLDYSISKDVDQNIAIMKNNLTAINEKMQENPRELKNLIQERERLSTKSEKVARQLDELKKSLKGIKGKEEVRKLSIKFEENEATTEQELKNYGQYESKILFLKQKITELEKSKKLMSQKNQEAERLLKSNNFSAELIRYTQKIYDDRIAEIREKLSFKVNRLFRRICKKDYHIRMNEDFVIDVFDSKTEHAKPVGKSTGENQMTSLSFIGSILEFAKEIKTDKNKYGSIINKYGGIYPLVMDSPFGSLDQTSSKNVAESLPSLSEQIVLMVSSTQWRNEVKNGMISKVGKQYVLCNHTPKPGKAAKVFIEYNGRKHPFAKSTDGPEFTEVEELV